MRTLASLCLVLVLAGAGRGDDRAPVKRPRMTLGDEGLPLTELRPNDRHVYLLMLDGRWTTLPAAGVVHYVNVLYPNGYVSSHRILDELQIHRGDVPVLFQEYELRNNLPGGSGRVEVVVSANRCAASTGDPAVVSNAFPVEWPLDRPVVPRPPRTRYTPPEEVESFPPPGEPPPVPRTPVGPGRPRAPLPPPLPRDRAAPPPAERVPAPEPKRPPSDRPAPPPDER